MRRILLSMAAVVLSLAVAATAQAGPKGNSKGGSSTHSTNSKGSSFSHSDSHHDYYLSHGSRMKDGKYFYKGRDHDHWSSRYFDSRYGCYCYYDSGLSCYYYWCEPDYCYYPISYCPYGKYRW